MLLNKEVEIAIIGGGSSGSSILYHLAKRHVTDTVLLEQGGQDCLRSDLEIHRVATFSLQHPHGRQNGLGQLSVFQEF